MTFPSPTRRLLPPLLALILLGACAAPSGPDDPVDSDDTPPPATDGANEPVLVVVDVDPAGRGITVEEALGHRPTDDIVVVTGALFVEPDGTVRVCDAILESFPPQCGGSSLHVDNLDLEGIGLEEANGVRWAERVTLIGSVE